MKTSLGLVNRFHSVKDFRGGLSVSTLMQARSESKTREFQLRPLLETRWMT